MTELMTDRLLIRDVVASDASCFLRYMQEEHYLRHVPVEPPTAGSIDALVNRCIENQSQNTRTDYFMAVVHKLSGEVIGEAILHIRSQRWRQGEIGWAVDAKYTDQGIATEIGQALLRFAFLTLDLHRVFAQCRVENQASRRIMVKLGMREEGVLRENVFARGEWWSSAQTSILSSEWSAMTKGTG
jgi:[ribosomal protein S5]-alanine N-acetyltransferase